METPKENRDRYSIGLIPDLSFRYLLTDCSFTITEILNLQKAENSSADLLAKAILGSFFISGLVKDETTVSIQLEGRGEIERVLAYSSRKGELRGLVKNPKVVGKIDDKTLGIGSGVFRISRWIGPKLIHQSLTEMGEESFEDNLHSYIYSSEQVSSYLSIYLNNKEKRPYACGIIFQALPEASTENKQALHNAIQILRESMDEVFLNKHLEESKKHIEEKLGFGLKELETGHPIRVCTCGIEKTRVVVKSLGKEEALSILQEQGKVELSCEFCFSKYSLDAEEVNLLFMPV
ncbi:MAG: Hsp33 family molecular chaperone HslO [Leptospiraceae bacterium]|nr:Hsp33 family molecular chaperone HslO [Leptospiraceae bacterium]MCP5502044.1 Hsp33 family molecular chaperone HslO [Leptospiraceae bacterium]